MANNRTYEIMYIASPETADDDVTKLNDTIVQLIEKEGGSVTTTEDMGRRKLAYPIEKKTEGHYVLFEMQGSGSEIAEIERRFRVNDAVIRYITVRVDEDRKRADKLLAKREARHGRRDAENNRGGANQQQESTAETQAAAQQNQ